MEMSIYLFGFLILCAVVTQCITEPIIGGSPVGRVISSNGKPVVINERHYPFMVYLQITESVSKRTAECGGTLIGSQTVLTAAHCLYDYIKPKVEVVAGVLHLKYEIKRAQIRRVKKYLIHQLYVDTCYIGKEREYYCVNDIALLWLAKPFKLSLTIQPAVLASHKSVVQNKIGVILGWGTIESGHSSDMLLKATQKVVPVSECEKEYDDTIFDSGKLCLISETKSSAFCYGDSGGPFASDGVVYGIGSFGRKGKNFNKEKNCLRDKPSVYTNVRSYEEWISASVRNWSLKEFKKYVRFEGIQPPDDDNQRPCCISK